MMRVDSRCRRLNCFTASPVWASRSATRHAAAVAGAHDQDLGPGGHDLREIGNRQIVALPSSPRLEDPLGRDDHVGAIGAPVDLAEAIAGDFHDGE